jgi:hypothetical protein
MADTFCESALTERAEREAPIFTIVGLLVETTVLLVANILSSR